MKLKQREAASVRVTTSRYRCTTTRTGRWRSSAHTTLYGPGVYLMAKPTPRWETSALLKPVSNRLWVITTARKLSLGQGNIFTSVCHSFCSRGGGRWVCIQGGGSASPSDTTGYGQQAGGMHPTGMHSCLSQFLNFSIFLTNTWQIWIFLTPRNLSVNFCSI